MKFIIVILIVVLPRSYQRPTRRKSGEEVLRVSSKSGIRSQSPVSTLQSKGNKNPILFLPTHGYLCPTKPKRQKKNVGK